MGETLLTVQNLSAWYSEEKRILSGFSFSLAEHEVAGLIGLNGARKTTFLKALSGLLPTFRSDGICFRGAPVDFQKQDFKLCRYTVFAEDNSFSYFTFREYLAYVCAAYGKGVPDVSEVVHGFHFEKKRDFIALRKIGFQTKDLMKIARMEFLIFILIGFATGTLAGYFLNQAVYGEIMKAFAHAYDAEDLQVTAGSIYENIQGGDIPSISDSVFQEMKATPGIRQVQDYEINYFFRYALGRT